MKLSIVTATFNRAEMLNRLYKSIVDNLYFESRNLNEKIKENDFKIEWIIVDDGSTDNTKEVVNSFKEEEIEIKYIYQQNSGKMQAINNGINYVTGELVVDCDSDDYFEEGAFKNIMQNANLLFKNSDIYALCFLKRKGNGIISGSEFAVNYKKTTMFDLYFKEDTKGEKILVFNTKIRKKYKHKVEQGECFVTESRMYHEMDKQYSIICINEAIEIGNYLEDGYTKNIFEVFRKNPNGYYKYFQEILKRGLKGVKFKKKIYVLKHFCLFEFFIVRGRVVDFLKD